MAYVTYLLKYALLLSPSEPTWTVDATVVWTELKEGWEEKEEGLLKELPEEKGEDAEEEEEEERLKAGWSPTLFLGVEAEECRGDMLLTFVLLVLLTLKFELSFASLLLLMSLRSLLSLIPISLISLMRLLLLLLSLKLMFVFPLWLNP